jgi:phospholipid-binding lipoprotein MlaA
VINFALQKDSEYTVKTVFRFIINTIFGFFGTVDVASKIGLDKKDTNFVETLKKWGAKPGPYLVLPLFGPTSFRGGISKAFSTQIDPIAQISLYRYKRNTRNRLYYAIYGLDLLAKYASIISYKKELEKISSNKPSSDMYVTTRNVVMQMEK